MARMEPLVTSDDASVLQMQTPKDEDEVARVEFNVTWAAGLDEVTTSTTMAGKSRRQEIMLSSMRLKVITTIWCVSRRWEWLLKNWEDVNNCF